MNLRLSRAAFYVTATFWILCHAPGTTSSVRAANGDTQTFSFGWNGNGQTGVNSVGGSTLIATPIDTASFAGKSITQVAAGEAHSLLLAEDGSVFSLGANASGRTGLGTAAGETRIATPIDVSNLAGKPITQVAAGGTHSLLLANDGSVFSFGSNFSGQTGLGTSVGDSLIPTPVNTQNLAGKSIVQIAAGLSHSLLLADDGSVFSFGWNASGQAGLGTTSFSVLVPTPIDTQNLAGKKIVQVAAGTFHSVLFADDGSVFSFGSNSFAQNEIGPGNSGALVATPINTDNMDGKKIIQIAAGSNHNLLLADDGSVFGFGWNNLGQTGVGASDEYFIAKPIDSANLAGKTITEVAAASFHSLLLADDGSVFSFGSNLRGRNGLGLNEVGGTRIATPIRTDNLLGLRVTDIFAGFEHSMLSVVPEPVFLAMIAPSLLVFAGRKRHTRRALRENVQVND